MAIEGTSTSKASVGVPEPPRSVAGSSSGSSQGNVVRKNYAPPQKSNPKNLVMYDADLGDGYYFRLSKFKVNERAYVNMGRFSKLGVTFPLVHIEPLERAIADLKRDFAEHFFEED